jgi:hypothetical protein
MPVAPCFLPGFQTICCGRVSFEEQRAGLLAVRQVEIRKVALPGIMAVRILDAVLVGRAEKHHVAIDANDPLLLTVCYRGVVRQNEFDGIGPVVLSALGAWSEVIAASEILVLKQGMAFAAEEEVPFMHRAFGPAERQVKIETLWLVVSAPQANARYGGVVKSHIAALLAEPPIGLELGHFRLLQYA